MKIILNGADASANNVGQTTVPLITTPQSQAYFDAIPTSFAAMSDAEKLAVNRFINQVNSQGLATKITHAFLPMIGTSDADEAFVNMFNPGTDISFPGAAFGTFNANGYSVLKGFSSGVSITKRDGHFGFYNTTSGANDDAHVSLGFNGSSYWVGRRVSTGNAGYLVDSSNKALVADVGGIGVVIGSNDYLNSKHIAIVGDVTNVRDVQAGTSGDVELVVGGTDNDSTARIADYAHGYFTMGAAMTESELIAYKNLINNLMTAFTS